MDDNLTDQQRADMVRRWLSENGWYLLGGLAVGLLALFGWRQWGGYSAARAEEASALYAELTKAIRVDRTGRAEEIAKQLADDFAATPYLDQARLAMARMKLERSLPDEAAAYLRDVMNQSESPQLVDIARMRLARVLISQDKHEEALKLLEVPRDSAFAARFHEARGDAYYAMGKTDEALSEYEAALKTAEPGTLDIAFVRAKLEQLGGQAPVSSPTAEAK